MDRKGCFMIDRLDGVKPVYTFSVRDVMNAFLTDPLRLDKICRICLNEKKELTSLFKANVYKMLNSFGCIQVSEDDNLPDLICTQCVLRCSKAYTFKHECERSDSILREYISPEFQEKLVKHIQSQMGQETEEPVQFCKKIKVKEDDEEVTFELVKYEYEPEVPVSGFTNSDPSKGQQVSIKQEMCTNQTIADNFDRQVITVQTPNTAANFKKDPKVPMRSHTKARSYICKVCNLGGFTEIRKLKSHMKSHTKTKEHRCNICGVVFTKKEELGNHKKQHTNDLPATEGKCLVCMKEFIWVKSLYSHRKRFKGHNLFACSRCGEEYTDVRRLTNHVQTCDITSTSITQGSDLEKQSEKHVGDKPQCCQFCGRECPPHKECIEKMKECQNLIQIVPTNTNIIGTVIFV